MATRDQKMQQQEKHVYLAVRSHDDKRSQTLLLKNIYVQIELVVNIIYTIGAGHKVSNFEFITAIFRMIFCHTVTGCIESPHRFFFLYPTIGEQLVSSKWK